jgi:hypothetical protein
VTGHVDDHQFSFKLSPEILITMASTEEPPPSKFHLVSSLNLEDTPAQEAPIMQQFDRIEGPRRPSRLPSRQSRRQTQVSALESYQVDEYRPPPIPKPPRPAGYIHPSLLFLWLVWVIGLGVWIAFAIRYKFNLFPANSVLNPIQNFDSFLIFLFFLGASSFVSLVLLPCLLTPRHAWFSFVSLVVLFSYVGLGLLILFIILFNRPFSCENMSQKFPVYVTLESGKIANAKVFVNNQVSWHLKHETRDGTAHTWISAEYLAWDIFLKGFVHQNISWPQETAVNHILTSLQPTDGADGTIIGTCKGQICLKGKIWTHPNLAFEWVYINPITGAKKTKRLASNEGEWYFGKENRPLVSLRNNGTEVFRAQSTTTVCTAGDGDLETSLVPVGLMFIAENNFNKI